MLIINSFNASQQRVQKNNSVSFKGPFSHPPMSRPISTHEQKIISALMSRGLTSKEAIALYYKELEQMVFPHTPLKKSLLSKLAELEGPEKEKLLNQIVG